MYHLEVIQSHLEMFGLTKDLQIQAMSSGWQLEMLAGEAWLWISNACRSLVV